MEELTEYACQCVALPALILLNRTTNPKTSGA